MRLIAQTYSIEPIIERLDPDSRGVPGKRGGLNGSLQPWLATYAWGFYRKCDFTGKHLRRPFFIVSGRSVRPNRTPYDGLYDAAEVYHASQR
jgi:hypothetical protein